MINSNKDIGKDLGFKIVEDREGEPRKLFWGIVLLLIVAGLALYILINSYNYPENQELAMYVPPRRKKTSSPSPTPSSSLLSISAREDMRQPPHNPPPPPPPPDPGGVVHPPNPGNEVPPSNQEGGNNPQNQENEVPTPNQEGDTNPPNSGEAVPPPPGSEEAVPPPPGMYEVPPPPELRSNYKPNAPPAVKPGKPVVRRRFIPDEPSPGKSVDFNPDRKILNKKIPVTVYTDVEGYVFVDNKIGRRCYGKSKATKNDMSDKKYAMKVMLKPGDYIIELEKEKNKTFKKISLLPGMDKYELYLQICPE